MASTKEKERHSFSDEKFKRNKQIADKLIASGFDIYLPQENQKETGEKTLKKELKVIDNCDFLIILLSDTRGIYLEAGYAKGIGKKVYAIKVEETREMSDWGYSFFDYVAKNTEELIEYLNKIK